MRIACDLDGVLADLHDAFAGEAVRLFPEVDRVVQAPDVGASPPDTIPASSGDPDPRPTSSPRPMSSPALSLSTPQSDAVWRSLTSQSNFWETLRETEPGIVRRLATLTDERRWEVLFVTSRPESAGDTVQRQSQRWLERQGFPLPSVYVVHGSRGQVVKALQMDVLIDDRPSNCIDVALEARVASMLIWRSTTTKVPGSVRRLEISVFHDVGECLDALVALDEARTGESLLDRLKQFIAGRRSRRTRR